MSNFRTILIVLLGIALIEALPASKPTLKPGSKPISKLRSFSSKNKGLVAEEKKIGSGKASKIAIENAEELKKGDRKKKSTTFCVEIRPDPTDKICDPAPSTVVHEHHEHHEHHLIPHNNPTLPVNPVPPVDPVPPVNPVPSVNPVPPVNPIPPMNPGFPEIPIIIDPPINIQPSPPVPPSTIILQPQPTIGCITSSLGPCPPSLYPSVHPSNAVPSSPITKNFYFATDPVLGATNEEEPTNPIEQPLPPLPPYYDTETAVVENPETPANARTVGHKFDYVIQTPVQPVYQTLYAPQNYRQQQFTDPCGSGFASTNVAESAGVTRVEDLQPPSGPVIPPQINTGLPAGRPRAFLSSNSMQALLSDMSNFRIISNPPNSGVPLGYQTLYRSYDPYQGSAGVPIPLDQSSNTHFQRRQIEEAKINENEEKSTSKPESLIFGGLLNQMRASKDSWKSGPTMQTFPREKTDQIQQLRTHGAQINPNSPSSDQPIVPTSNSNNEGQSIVTNLNQIGEKAIDSGLNTSEAKRQ